jgi:putative ABC transport system substrate-binding protein
LLGDLVRPLIGPLLVGMNKKILASLFVVIALAVVPVVQAQPKKQFRIGVVHEGGEYSTIVDGLKDGLRELGLEPGRDVLLEVRAIEGNRAAAAESARSLEQAKVDLLYILGTSVTIAAKAATTKVPIVFVAGGDPVAYGLVASLARPGGRLTGVHYLTVDLTAKRLEILKEALPNLRRIVTFYDPSNPVQSIRETRQAARRLGIDIVERPVTSVVELRQSFAAFTPNDTDAYFYTPDAMVVSQTQFVIDTAKAKRLPTIVSQPDLVAQGALIGYGVNFYDIGRLSAKYVQRVFTGTGPENMPVESFSRLGLGINLKTAHELGITIPQAVLFRADKVIE